MGKVAAPRTPLWVFLLAAQLVDVAWSVFILLGVERFHLDPTLPSNPLVLDHMPYTHSLVGTLGWAGLAAAAVMTVPRLGGSIGAALAVGLVVVSHWFLDLVVHRPDLTLWGADPRLGLGLWNQPSLAYAVEVLTLAGAAALYAARSRLDGTRRRAFNRGIALLIALQTVSVLGPPPPSPTALVLTMLVLFTTIAWSGARLER